MTTRERLRSFWGDRQIEPGRLTSVALRYWQIVLFVALIGLAAGLRLWDLGERAIHHDESIHIKYAWSITKEGLHSYVHDPTYHGPFAYFGNAVVFIIFGANDYTARVLPALFGIALVGLPFLLRRQFGTVGTFVAAGLLAVSPSILYFSRFARNDIFILFFMLALVVCIWRYLSEPRGTPEPTGNEILDFLGERRNAWLVAMAPLLMLSFAAKEVTFITAAILIVFLNIMVAIDLVDQLSASRSMSLTDTVLAYVVLLPTAWAIVALWPLLEDLRRRFSISEMPAAGPPLLILGTLAAPQYAAAIQKLPFIEDKGYMAEGNLMRASVLILILAGAYVGLLWNWRVWLVAAALFYVPFVVLFTSLFTNMGGFWTGIWGSLDYWLGQQHVRRGDQPDYYYFITLPVYEFLPLVFALGGALYYAFRGKVEQQLMAASALLLILVFSLMSDDVALIGKYHIQAAFIIAIGAVLLLSMETFTKFLLFWTLSALFAITVAGEKMPWMTVHVALPLSLLAAKVLDDVFSARVAPAGNTVPQKEARGKRGESAGGRQDKRQPAGGSPFARFLPLVYAGILMLGAAGLFQAFGPASGISAVAWLLSLGAAAAVVWTANTVSWRAAGQVAVVALFAALLVFTFRAGGMAAFRQGEPGGTPRELLIYAQGSPGLGVIADEIDRLATESGRGKDLAIFIDNSGGQNIWPWPWYLRDYHNVSYRALDEDFAPPPGSVVLIRQVNQPQIEPYLDQFQEGIPYTHMWWFPEFYRGLHATKFLEDVFTGHYLSTWRGYFIDRVVPGATAGTGMIAYFPSDFDVTNVPVGPTGPATSDLLPTDSVTIIGGQGTDKGQLSQPADLTVDAEGNVYVVDTLNQRIQKFAPDGTVETLGESGTGEGQFGNPALLYEDYDVNDGPWGIAVDGDGNIYVADTWNSRIQKFNADLEFVTEWGSSDFFGPRDVEIDSDGNVLVVDTGHNRIWEYDTDGRLVAEHGSGGGDEGEFNEPTSIAVAPNGDLYVADFWNKRIQHFDSQFQYIDEIEVESWGSKGVTDRAYVVALDDGTVLATDPANQRIIVFDPSGEEAAAWRLPSDTGFTRPIGIAVDAEDQVYITDNISDVAGGRVVRVPLAVLLLAEAGPEGTP